MPLELGMAMARRFIDPASEHDWLVLVPRGHTYARFVSDVTAYDPVPHDGSVHGVVVLAEIMKQGLQVTAIGLTIGLGGALAVNRLIASLLFGVQPTDIVTIALVIATITAVAVIASWLPAWRASRLDPNVVLRDE